MDNGGIKNVLDLFGNKLDFLGGFHNFHLLTHIEKVIFDIFKHVDFADDEFAHTVSLSCNP